MVSAPEIECLQVCVASLLALGGAGCLAERWVWVGASEAVGHG